MRPALRTQALREWNPLAAVEPPPRAAHPLGALVPGVMKSLGLEQRLRQSEVFHRWTEIAGPDIARHAQPVSLRNGVLIVHIDHPTWHHALLPVKPLLLQKIRERIGKTAVRELVFRIG